MNMNMGPMNGDITVAPGQHAFVMLGERTLFLCHLTMFHDEEHRFQLVLRATLPDDAMRRYLADRKANPDATYFLGNSTDDLMTVQSIQSGRRDAFKADVFRGIPIQRDYPEWPWKNQTPIIAGASVRIDHVVYARHFDFGLAYPEKLTYVVFGMGDEAHLTHYQVKEPDYDHVLSLARAPAWLPAEALEAGVHLNCVDLPQDMHCTNPLTSAEQRVTYAGLPAPIYTIEPGKSYWFSTKIVNMNDPCPPHDGP
ncbi:MAG: hypothetical protein M3N49_02855 [Candidatus Eremiobacteraeota bacterium]|nr:hypothetical protein [Candidatus Eremiobacteraeota bacterium]